MGGQAYADSSAVTEELVQVRPIESISMHSCNNDMSIHSYTQYIINSII